MKSYSIFNDVLGPVMHGPSSSHTAASFRISVLARDLFGRKPDRVRFLFDRRGSYGRVYSRQGSDLAFAAGILGWDITDRRFREALKAAAEQGIDIIFTLGTIDDDDHPNAMEIEISDHRERLTLSARSVGGGSLEITRMNGREVRLTGGAYEMLVEASAPAVEAARRVIDDLEEQWDQVGQSKGDDTVWFHLSRFTAPGTDFTGRLENMEGVRVWTASPIFYPEKNSPLFESAQGLIALAEERGWSMGEAAIHYESTLLGLPRETLMAEMESRYEIMVGSVREGLENYRQLNPMQVLEPTAHKVFQAESQNRLAIGGLHTRAAARAMAVMHVNAGLGLVCAAPTGGSSGTLPGVLVSLEEDAGVDRETVIRALWAASAVGLVIVARGHTFAAEVAGCQVEIGAAGAMAAAAVVEAAGGSTSQAADAAAIALHNTMGSPCDLVQGAVEIPCHTRNAVAASSAFVCADLILGGYQNPIGLDDSVDASLAVGKALPSELRCTVLGGLAVTPSARAIQPKR